MQVSTAPREGIVPREYLGLARQLREKIAADGTVTAQHYRHLFKPLKTAWNKHPRHKVRYQLLEEAMRAWRDLPPHSRLGQARMQLTGRHELIAAEVRLLAGSTTFSDWLAPAPEAALGAELTTLHVGPRYCEITFQTLGTFSLHALARRYERGTAPMPSLDA